MSSSRTAEKNQLYFAFERRILIMALWSGFFLWGLFFAGIAGIAGPVFDILWIAHLLAHVTALFFTCGLFVSFVRTVSAGDGILLGFGAAGCVAFIAGFGILPIISRDALIYHLAVPKFWLEAGRIVEIPWHEWSHFPLLLSLGYTGFLKHDLLQLTPFYHATYLFLTCGVIAAFVYYKFQDEYLGLATALLALSIPVCAKLAAEPMSDFGLSFYFGAAFALFVFWGEQRGKLSQLAIVGALLGLALCTKYNAILACVMFGLCMISFLQRWNFTIAETVKSIAVVALIAVVVYLPWPVKNYLTTGNPLYPFAGGVFGVSDELPFMGTVQPIEYRRLGYGESWGDIALIPLRMMMFGRDDIPQHFDGLLTPILLFAVLPLLFKREGERRQPWVMNSWIFIAGYFTLSLMLFYALVRYQSPLLVPICVLTAHGIYIASALVVTYSRVLTYRVIIVLQLAWFGWYFTETAFKVTPADYWFGNESREEYLQRRLSEYDVVKFVNASLPKDARVYLLFTGNRYFYYDREVRGSYFSHTPIIKWLREKPDADHLAQGFRSEGITHIAIHSRRTWESLNTTLNDEQKSAWTDFAKRYLELMFQDGAQTVWKLRTEPNPA